MVCFADEVCAIWLPLSEARRCLAEQHYHLVTDADMCVLEAWQFDYAEQPHKLTPIDQKWVRLAKAELTRRGEKP